MTDSHADEDPWMVIIGSEALYSLQTTRVSEPISFKN